MSVSLVDKASRQAAEARPSRSGSLGRRSPALVSKNLRRRAPVSQTIDGWLLPTFLSTVGLTTLVRLDTLRGSVQWSMFML
jgi:hypothetical protein